jgi:hypothetical protein
MGLGTDVVNEAGLMETNRTYQVATIIPAKNLVPITVEPEPGIYRPRLAAAKGLPVI